MAMGNHIILVVDGLHNNFPFLNKTKLFSCESVPLKCALLLIFILISVLDPRLH